VYWGDDARRIPKAYREGWSARTAVPARDGCSADSCGHDRDIEGLKETYEVHHGIRIQDAALVAAATLSDRYVSDRFLPDKAIDLVDEAAAKIKIEVDSMPAEVDAVARKLVQLQIEEEALKKERDAASKARAIDVRRQIAELEETSRAMRAQWQSEREIIQEIRKTQPASEDLRREADAASAKGTSAASQRFSMESYLRSSAKLLSCESPWRGCRRRGAI